MLKIVVTEHGPEKFQARITSVDNRVLKVGPERPSIEAAIGAIVLSHPQDIDIIEVLVLITQKEAVT